MNNKTKTQANFVYSEAAQQVIILGMKNHMRFRVIGYGEVPTRPFFRGAWWFEPVKDAPEKAQERLSMLKTNNITYKGFVIAHEVYFVEKKEEEQEKKPDFKITPIVTDTTEVVSGLVMGFFAVAALVIQAILSDPALIVVLEDGTWLEVMTWYE